MSVEFIAGKPGSGKSLFAMGLVIKELTEGTRVVVTNLAVKLPELNVYLQAKHPDVFVDLVRRLVLLNEKELGDFYLIRAPGHRLPLVKDDDEDPKSGLRGDYSSGKLPEKDGGVFYVLDELHIKFSARAWMKTGPAAMYYLSQHRKLGDDVFCITQATSNVDKQFRSVAQEFHQLRNLSKERWGVLRGPATFRVDSFLQQPTSPTDESQYRRNFSFPAEVAETYDTAAGVGILGVSGADKGTKRKGGISFRWLWVGFAVLGLGVVITPWAVTTMFSKAAAKKAESFGVTPANAGTKLLGLNPGISSSAPGQVSPAKKAETSDFNGSVEGTKFTGAGPVLVEPPAGKQVWVRGWAQRGGKLNVVLSDGRTLTEEDGTLERRTRSFVDFKSGERLWLMSPTVGAPYVVAQNGGQTLSPGADVVSALPLLPPPKGVALGGLTAEGERLGPVLSSSPAARSYAPTFAPADFSPSKQVEKPSSLRSYQARR